MTIEEKALKQYSTTENPRLAVWMLKDGTLLDGSYEGLQRDIDHREISQFFKPSKLADPGSAFVYVWKFLRRGNIRMGCSDAGFTMEYAVTPTKKQLDAMQKIHGMAEECRIETCIFRRTARKRKWERTGMSWDQFLAHLYRYGKNDAYCFAAEQMFYAA